MESFDTLAKYGADPDSILPFDQDGPRLLPYSTLLSARKSGDPVLAALVGVYEWQNTPLVFLVDNDKIQRPEDLNRIRRLLAMRGDAPYLGVVRPGQLALYRVSLDSDPLDRTVVEPSIQAGEEQAILPYLGNQRPNAGMHRHRYISKVVLKLLSSTIGSLNHQFEVADNDAISLVGRALFARFLADRELLPSPLFSGGPGDASALFDNPNTAAKTSLWLDATFNGDFLPVSEKVFRALPLDGYKLLGDIMRRASGGQLHLGWEERWENLDFAHIPVGVLSQAYEQYLREHASKRQRKEGSYYTPGIIADMLIRGAFHALRRDGVAHEARILDASAGAGVFLITAFRQLVAERWLVEGRRPDTRTLRSILYGQITGFDINEAALRFAALGLYLASIELDPDPEPLEKLRFKNLRGTVLHNVGDCGGNLCSRGLGSLGSRVGAEHSGRYDLVVGNPPWASNTGLPGWAEVGQRVTQIASTRVPQGPVPKLPNEVLDLPFVWRAMDWAKPGGQIAFALHARLLFQQADGMSDARAALFSAMNVTGIVNGSDLRHTNVWPGVSAPFCLLFARNELPPPGSGFKFVSPRYEKALNDSGNWRVDVSNAETIVSDQVVKRPELLKILFRGSALDLEVYDRLKARKMQTLKELWPGKFAGNGYQRLRQSSEVKGRGDGLPGESTADLIGLPELSPAAMETVLVDPARLVPFTFERVHRARSRDLYCGPMLIVHEVPPAKTSRIQVAVADDDVAFSQSYNGYSARQFSQGRLLVRYLALVLGSRPALWHALIVSGRFGLERDVVEKFTIDRTPIPSFESLDTSDLGTVERFFDDLAANNSEDTWTAVDAWVASLYGLGERDLQVISDTLNYNLPFKRTQDCAQSPPKLADISVFCSTLRAELTPWAQRMGGRIEVLPERLPPLSPWGLVRIQYSGAASERPVSQDWQEIVRIADQLAATEIIHPDSEGECLWLARLNQARYWSRSQATLAARRVLWEHIDFLARLGGR